MTITKNTIIFIFIIVMITTTIDMTSSDIDLALERSRKFGYCRLDFIYCLSVANPGDQFGPGILLPFWLWTLPNSTEEKIMTPI